MKSKTKDYTHPIISVSAFILAVIAGLSGCAKVGAPTGGEKDLTPPKYMEGTPENRSTHFTGNDLSFEFDEFIQLKDLNRELLISPPLKEKPIIRLKDKSIRVDMNNDLYPETTYTINFGKSISDLNEGNPLPDFEYVFSTGSIIDSLSVAGKTLDAKNHKVLKDTEILVMLYENLEDSVPILEIPRYIGRANENGLFAINNIKADTFRIMALNDANGNLKYDPGMEEVAFLDSFLIISASTVKPITFIKDTVKVQKELKKPARASKKPVTTTADTLIVQGKKLNALNVSLYYFEEETNKVFLDVKKRESPEKLFFVFSRPLHDSVHIQPLNFSPGMDWYIKEESAGRDTITYWIMDTVMAKKDTLKFSFSYTTTDSMDRFTWRTDTINFRYQAAEKKNGRKARVVKAVTQDRTLAVSSSVPSKGTLNLNSSLFFSVPRPLRQLSADSIALVRMQDSLVIPQSFTTIRDSSGLRKFRIASGWEENTKYKLLLKPGAIEDVYGLKNDSLEISFSTPKAEFYGRILITVQGRNMPAIIQIIDEKGRIVKTKYVLQEGQIVFDYLAPDKYVMKAIYDRNGNRKWDTAIT